MTYLDRKDIHLIRPLVYMTESQVVSFAKRYGCLTLKNPCPADGVTKRQYMKETIAKLNRENHGLPERVFTAIKSSLDDWKTEGDVKL